MVGIYKITNEKNYKCYIGQSRNINLRFKKHIAALKNNNHRNSHLQRAFNKYGEDSFKFEIIEECEEDKLNNKEMHYIEFYKSLIQDNGYNLIFGGKVNRCHNLKTRKLMSMNRKGKKPSKEIIKKRSLARKLKGWKHTEESKEKMRKSAYPRSGELNINAIISNEIASKIIHDLYLGINKKDIVEKYIISLETVKNLAEWRSYKDIDIELRQKIKDSFKNSMNIKIENAVSLYQLGNSQNSISKILNISRNTLSRELKKRGIDTTKHKNQYVNTEVSK